MHELDNSAAPPITEANIYMYTRPQGDEKEENKEIHKTPKIDSGLRRRLWVSLSLVNGDGHKTKDVHELKMKEDMNTHQQFNSQHSMYSRLFPHQQFNSFYFPRKYIYILRLVKWRLGKPKWTLS